MILNSLTVGMFQENCYIFGDEESRVGAIVDPGDEAARIAMAVEELELEIQYILITHPHVDHIGAVSKLADEYICQVLMHPEAVPMLEQAPANAAHMGVRFGDVPGIDRLLKDDETLDVGGLQVRALYTPGHAPGHLAYYLESQRMVFTGDALFLESIGRTDLSGGDLDTLLHGIRSKLLTLPDKTVVYPGHGDKTTIGYERLHNPFLTDGEGLLY